MASFDFITSAEAWSGGGYDPPPFVTNLALPAGDIVIMVQNGDGVSDYALTVDGVSADRVFNNTTGEKTLVVFTISLASSGTKTVSIGGGAYISRLLLVFYEATGLDITAITDSAIGPFAYVDPGPKATDDPLIVPTDGLGIAMGVNDSSGAITWNNGTPLDSFLAYGSSKQITLASFAAGTSLNPSITPPAPYQGTAIVGVAFGPPASTGVTGSASGTLSLTGSAAAVVGVKGVGAGQLPLTGSSTTRVGARAAAAGTLPLTGAATAKITVKAAGTGILPLTGVSTTKARVGALASGSLALTGSAAGSAIIGIVGNASGTLGLTGSAVGTVGVVAAATGGISLSGTATAVVAIIGSATGSLALGGSADGTSSIVGAAVGAITLTGSASGTVIGSISGTAAGVLPLSGASVGTVNIPSPIPADRIITPLALRTMLTLDAQSVIVTPPRQCCVIILTGYEEVLMSSEYFQWPDKLAPAVIFYGVDWARRLGEATIISHDFELVSGGVTLTPRAADGTETSVSIAGGSTGSIAVIIASVVASDGEVHAIRVSIDIT